MGKVRDHGVVDSFGRVCKGNGTTTLTDTYQDFYIIDGGIAPTSLGVNSSLTISALAFRIAENIVASKQIYCHICDVLMGIKGADIIVLYIFVVLYMALLT